MHLFDLAQAAAAVGGAVEGSGTRASVRRVTIDSRQVEEGDLFVALPGTRVDGHAFVADALRAGAAGALVGPHAPPLPADVADRAQIRTADPRAALADLAAWHRLSLTCPVVGITGSAGKSSTREMTARVLEPLGPVVQSPKSYNNLLGVSLTVLRADAATRALVVEMGTSGPGEIEQLVRIARPNVGVVVNVGASHLEGLGSEDGVAAEKAALPEGLPPGGFAILCADDRRVAAMAERTRANVVTASLGDWHSTVWGCDARRTARGVEWWLYGKGRMFLPVPGLHNARNAVLAAAVGLVHGVGAEQLREAFRRVRLPAMRLQRMAVGGATLVLDCYNASPLSMAAAVEELAARASASPRAPAGRRILVMGDMLELGVRSAELHYTAGAFAAKRVDALWCVGSASRHAHEAAIEAGMDPERALWFPTVEDAMASPALALGRGDVALLKASRGVRLERLAEPIRRRLAEAGRERREEREGVGAAADDASRMVG